MTDKLLHDIRVFLNEVAQHDMFGNYRIEASYLLDDIYDEGPSIITKDWPEWLKFGPVKCWVWDQPEDDHRKIKTIIVGYQKAMHGEHEVETFLSYGPPGPQEWLHAEPITHTS